MSRVSKPVWVALAVVLSAAILALPAQAKTEQIKSGKTSVTMSPLVKALHLINKLIGMKVAHAGQDLGQLTMAVKMA